jgi:hypothetical protein
MEWQEKPIITSFWNGWRITRGTQPERNVLFSMLQLVTSDPEDVDIPEAQPMQSLPCSSHVPATRHDIASVYSPRPSTFVPLITTKARPWSLQ